jgi:hypothetical protein
MITQGYVTDQMIVVGCRAQKQRYLSEAAYAL